MVLPTPNGSTGPIKLGASRCIMSGRDGSSATDTCLDADTDLTGNTSPGKIKAVSCNRMPDSGPRYGQVFDKCTNHYAH